MFLMGVETKNTICDIILLSWNKLEYTRPCIESIFRYTSLPCRLLVVDNNSEEETKSYLKSLQGTSSVKVEVIFNKENLGYVGGMNEGLKRSQAPYVCLLNNDTLVTPQWLELCLEAFKRDPAVGVVNSHSSTFGLWPKKNQTVEEVAQTLYFQHQSDPVTEIGTCVGFCMLIKREVIDKIGYLEESLYKFFFEDTDYCKRAKKAGYFCVVANQAYVFHYEHKSLEKKSQRDEFFKRNQKWFYEKWGRPLRIFWPKETACTQKEKELLTQIARDDHFIFLFSPKATQENWSHRHAHISLRYHSFKMLELPYFLWAILKKQKKPYDYIITQDFPILNKFRCLMKGKCISDIHEVKEVAALIR